MLFGDGFGECFYLGEGAAFIVLESEKSLKKRIGKHYASIVDYSVSFDGENVHNSSIRSPAVLNRNIQNLKNHIKKKNLSVGPVLVFLKLKYVNMKCQLSRELCRIRQ